MILILARFLTKLFPRLDITKAQRIAIFIIGPILAIILIFLILQIRSCFKREAKIDLERIEKINKANESDRKKELRAIIEENADVVSTVDNRTVIAETNVVERNRLIDEKIKAVDQKIAEARAGGRNITGPELECLLIPENCE